MTANFLFSQVPNQTPPPDFGRGTMGVSEQSRSDVSKTCDILPGESRSNSFLNTLEQISKDNQHNKTTHGIGGGKSFASAATKSGDKVEAISRQAIGDETEIFETTKLLAEDHADVECQITPGSNLTVVSSIFKELGLYDSAGGSSSADKVDWILDNAEGSAALQKLLARPDQEDLVLSSEMKAVFVRLQQFIANVQTGNTLSQSDGNPLGELSDSRSMEPANLNQLAERIVSGQGEQRSSSGIYVGESDSGEKPSDPLAELNRVTNKISNDIRQPGSFQPAENSQIAPRSENMNKTDSIKLSVEPRPVGVEASENAKVPRPLEAVRTEISELKDVADIPVKAGAANQASLVNRIPSTIYPGKQAGGESAQQNLSNNESSQVIKMTNNAQAAKTLDPVQRYGGEHVQNNMVNNESSPVSKMIHDAQLAKENHMRMDGAISDELSGKVTKVDTGANDNGLLGSQNQSAEKAFEATSSSKQTANGDHSLRNQTLDQIVRKAVIYMRNGQHEAKIDLKPEFLGHVRMQVTTENHQVTVKILTEFGFVKDMVENNIHQLKADLQQQGLNVDKLEVAVSNDSDEHKHPQGKADQAKDRRSRVARINPGSREGETREQDGNVGLRKAGTATVDYFA